MQGAAFLTCPLRILHNFDIYIYIYIKETSAGIYLFKGIELFVQLISLFMKINLLHLKALPDVILSL